MIRASATEQVLQRVAATITVTLVDQYGEGAAAGGAVTVDIATVAGTTVATARSTSAGSGTGAYTASLTAAETASLDLLVCTWKDGGTARATTLVEVQGATYGSKTALAVYEPSLGSLGTSQWRTALRQATEECERICGVSWVPRYRFEQVELDGGTALLPTPLIRSIRSAVDEDGTTVSVSDVEVIGDLSGRLVAFPSAGEYGVLTVGWEHGADRPPEAVLAKVARRVRYLAALSKSPDMDRQARLVMQDGQTIALASAGPFSTGDDEVDSVYMRHGYRVPGIA